jgi:uncharacterized RDD family membrane protein YckC
MRYYHCNSRTYKLSGPYEPEQLKDVPGFSADSFVSAENSTESNPWKRVCDVPEVAALIAGNAGVCISPDGMPPACAGAPQGDAPCPPPSANDAAAASQAAAEPQPDIPQPDLPVYDESVQPGNALSETSSVPEWQRPMFEDGPAHFPLSGWLRRLFANMADALLLGLLGLLLGKTFSAQFCMLGPWARLPGLAIYIIYFTFFTSGFGGGQTPGMRLAGTRVANASGEELGLSRSALRCIVFLLPVMLGGACEFISPGRMVLWFYCAGAASCLAAVNAYFLVFNRRTGQGLHDMISGAYVERTSGDLRRGALPPVWAWHWAAIALLLASGGLLARRDCVRELDIADLVAARQSVEDTGRWYDCSVMRGFGMSWSRAAGFSPTSNYVYIGAVSRSPLPEGDAGNMELARILLRAYPQAFDSDRIIISARYGYDMGIARWLHGYSEGYSGVEWRAMLERQASGRAHPVPAAPPPATEY